MALAILTIAVIGGCASILDIDQFSVVDTNAEGGPDGAGSPEGGTPTGDANVEPDAKPTCTLPSKCMKAPPGYDGPFAVVEGASACPSSFLRSWERVGGTVDAGAPPASCTCSCGKLTGTCAVKMFEHDGEDCTGSVVDRPLPLGTCLVQTDGNDGFRVTATAQGQCPPDASTTVAPLDAGTLALGCSPTDPAPCTEGTCFPPLPTGTRVCVRPNSGSECPSDFPSKVSIPAGFEDTRGCSPCTCVASPTCAFTYKLYESETCTEGALTFSDLECHGSSGVDSFRLESATVNGTCAPNGGSATGGVTVKSVSTLCCLP